jgi:hypothetical protein
MPQHNIPWRVEQIDRDGKNPEPKIPRSDNRVNQESKLGSTY